MHVPRTFRSTIRLPFTVAFVLAVLLPAIGINTLTAVLGVRTAVTRSQSQLETVTALKEAQIDFWLEEMAVSLAPLAVDENFLLKVRQSLPDSDFPTLRDSAAAEVETMLGDQLRRSTQFNDLFLTTVDGTFVVGTRITAQTLDDVDFFDTPPEEPIIREITYSTGTFDTSVTVLYPVLDGPTLIAVVGGIADTASLDAIMQDTAGLGETGNTYIIDEEKTLLTPSRFEGYFVGETTVNTALASTALDGETHDLRLYTSYHGDEVIGSYRWLTDINALLIAEQNRAEVLEPTYFTLFTSTVITLVAAFGVAIVALYIVNRGVLSSLVQLSETAQQIADGDLNQRVNVQRDDEIGVLANTFNTMTASLSQVISERDSHIQQIELLNNTLEQRVNARTRDLQVAAEVSRQVTTVLDADTLLPQLVELTREAFGLYYASIFLYTEASRTLDLSAATGEAGERMLAEGKAFDIDTEVGLVPRAARQREYHLSNNVAESPEHFYNKHLPDTQSEIALPMTVGDQLVGVLDLQSAKVGRFTDDDIRVMSSLAEQIAVAVRNAQLFEQEREARQEVERANAVKSQFLASVSHELRTPLNAIINFTKFIQKEMMGPINERQDEVLEKVKSSGVHLLNLINDVLDISKIESGSLALFVESDINVNALLDKALTTSQALVADKPVSIKTDIDPELPPITADKQRVLQIILNVMSNACKFTNEGHITLRAHHDGTSITVEVEDTGDGIPAEEANAVFESFRQTDTGLRQGSGTGLGMPISKKLAEAHDGDLTFVSTVGKGTTFTLTLPVHSESLKPITI